MEKHTFVKEKNNEIILTLHVKPNSKMQMLELETGNSLVVYLKSPPDKGKANKELIKLLAKFFECSSANIFIVSGQTSRDKTLVIKNSTIDQIYSCLQELEK